MTDETRNLQAAEGLLERAENYAAAYTNFGRAVWLYMNTHKRTFEPWLTKLFDKAFISRPQPTDRPDAVDWKALAREAQRSRDEAWNTAAALRSLFTTYEAPPLPNGKVLIQHQVTGAPVRLHEKGHPCVICDALDAAAAPNAPAPEAGQGVQPPPEWFLEEMQNGGWVVYSNHPEYASHRFSTTYGKSKAQWLRDTLNAPSAPAPLLSHCVFPVENKNKTYGDYRLCWNVATTMVGDQPRCPEHAEASEEGGDGQKRQDS